jgi:hypothetical protein
MSMQRTKDSEIARIAWRDVQNVEKQLQRRLEREVLPEQETLRHEVLSCLKAPSLYLLTTPEAKSSQPRRSNRQLL